MLSGMFRVVESIMHSPIVGFRFSDLMEDSVFSLLHFGEVCSGICKFFRLEWKLCFHFHITLLTIYIDDELSILYLQLPLLGEFELD